MHADASLHMHRSLPSKKTHQRHWGAVRASVSSVAMSSHLICKVYSVLQSIPAGQKQLNVTFLTR